MASKSQGIMKIGWAQEEITPQDTTLIAGQFHARISEGINDPLTTTAMALDSGEDHAVMVSCDLVAVSDELREMIRSNVDGKAPGLDPMKVVMNGTHTHTAPPVRMIDIGGASGPDVGIDLPVMPIPKYLEFVAERVARAIVRAWDSRTPGKISYGMGYAVIGRNRRVVYRDGTSAMYGKTDTPDFANMEGYEDHSVNLLATYDNDSKLTGLAVNIPCPSQLSESEFKISADFWHETRNEIRRRIGGNSLFILPQCSAAGDQSPRPLYEKAANSRMLELAGRTPRQELANRISNAVAETLLTISDRRDNPLPLRHHSEFLDVPANKLTEADAQSALKDAEEWRKTYEEKKREINADPSIKEKPRWYMEVTKTYRRMKWYKGVAERFERQKTNPNIPAEIHVIRLGDIAFATNPYEYYLDHGVVIKARSKAMQTFIVQLAGGGTYVPSWRSIKGGGYGSIPSSNPVGPEGGEKIAERTLEIIDRFWSE